MLVIQELVREAPAPGDVLKDVGFASPLTTTYSFTAAHTSYAYAWFDGRSALRPASAAGLRLGDGKKPGANGEE